MKKSIFEFEMFYFKNFEFFSIIRLQYEFEKSDRNFFKTKILRNI